MATKLGFYKNQTTPVNRQMLSEAQIGNNNRNTHDSSILPNYYRNEPPMSSHVGKRVKMIESNKLENQRPI